ncbi:hypothetical protein JJO83_13310 [Halomonas aquamarina]|uniref:hypothetical protein n=1 Tax=Vreelandella aquamarina TaxID=77097 RepID=UPI002359B081|nr:hypothetical protein [Halomonas aquamarina]MDC8443662.1 hypothetical protein [Halomonas aquamarina]
MLTEAVELGDELPEVYELTDATADLGALKVAEVAAAQANAQDIVGGAANADELTLEVSYSIEDSAASLVEADAAVLEAATSVTVTDSTITLEQASALEGVVAELPPIGDTAANLSGKTGLGEQALQANTLDGNTAYNFEGHQNLTVTVDQTITLNGQADLAGATVEIASGRTLTLSAEQVTQMSQAGGSIVGDGKVVVTGLNGDGIYDLSAIETTATAGVGEDEALRADTKLGNIAIEVETGDTLTLTAEQATGREITGAGDVAIELAEDGQYDFSGVDTDAASVIKIAGEVTLATGTDFGDVEAKLQAGAKVTLDAATAHRAEIDATASTLIVTGNQSGLRLDGVTEDSDTTIDVSEFEGTLARLPGGSSTKLATGIDGKLIMRSDQATGKVIEGTTSSDGTLELVDLDGQVDLSKVDVDKINATVSSNQTLGAGSNLNSDKKGGDNNVTITIEDGVTLTANGGDIDSLVVNNADDATGTLRVVGNDTGINLSDVDADIDLGLLDNDATITGVIGNDIEGQSISGKAIHLDDKTLANADVTLVGNVTAQGIVDGDNYDLTGITNLTVDGGSVNVGSGATLTLTAAQADGVTITGAGTVVLEGGDADASYDLSGISANLNIAGVNAEAELTLPEAVANNRTLTVDVDQLDGVSIAGSGTIAIDQSGTNGQLTADADLTGITADITGAIDVNTHELTLRADQADDRAITNAPTGSVVITGLDGEAYDFSGITAVNASAVISSNLTLNADTVLAGTESLELVLENDAQVTLSAAQADTVDITNQVDEDDNEISNGTAIITGELGAEVLSGIETVLDLRQLDAASTISLSGLSASSVLITAAQADGATIAGAPTVVTGTLALAAANDGTLAANLSGIADLDLRQATIPDYVDANDEANNGVTLTLAGTQSVTIDVAQLAKFNTLDDAATGNVNITGISTEALDLSAIDIAGNLTLTYTGGEIANFVEPPVVGGDFTLDIDADASMVEFVATTTGVDGVTVADDVTLTMDSASANNLTQAAANVTGTDATVVVTGSLTDVDLSALQTATVDLSNATGQAADLPDGLVETLILTAATADGADISFGAPKNVEIVGELDGQDLSGITSNLDVTGITPAATPAELYTALEQPFIALNGVTDAEVTGSPIVLTIPGAGDEGADLTISVAIDDPAITTASGLATALSNGIGTESGLPTGYSVEFVAAANPGDGGDITITVPPGVNVTDTVTLVNGGSTEIAADATADESIDGAINLENAQKLTASAQQINGLAVEGTPVSQLIVTGSPATDANLNLINVNVDLDVTGVEMTGGDLRLPGRKLDSEGNFVETELAENQELTIRADQASGNVLIADATDSSIVVTQLDGAAAYDLSAIQGTATATISETTELDTGTDLGVVAVTVDGENDDVTLTLTAAQANGATIVAAADNAVVINGLAADSDFTGLTATGDITVNVSDSVELNASDFDPAEDQPALGTGIVYNLAEGVEVTAEAAQVAGLTFNGAGSLVVTGGYDDEVIGGTAAVTIVDPAVGADFTADLNLNTAAEGEEANTARQVTVEFTDDATLTAADFLFPQGENVSVVIADDKTLTLNADAGVDELAISGGTVVLDGDLDGLDLSNIASNIEIASSATNVSAATFPTLAADQTVTGDAADLTGATIAGEGTVTVTALEGDLGADLSDLTANSVVAELDSTGNVTFQAVDLGQAEVRISGNGEVSSSTLANFGTASFVVGADATLLLRAAQAEGRVVTGEGNVTVSVDGDNTDVDLSNIEMGADSDVVLAVDSAAAAYTGRVDLDLRDNATLDSATKYDVATNTFLFLTAEQASGRTLEGVDASSVINVTGGEAGVAYDFSDLADDLTLDLTAVAGDITLPVSLEDGQTVYVTAAQISGQEISVEDGATLNVMDLHLTPDADLSGLTGAGDINAHFDLSDYASDEINFTGQLSENVNVVIGHGTNLRADLDTMAGYTVSGDGTLVLTSDEPLVDGNFELVTSSLDLSGVELQGFTNLPGSGDLTNGQTVTIAASAMNNRSVTQSGDGGTLALIGDINNANFTGITSSLDLTGATLTGETQLPGRVDENEVASLSATLTLTGEQAAVLIDGNEVAGAGTLTIIGDVAGLDLRDVATDLDLRDAQLGSDTRLPGQVGSNVNLGADQTLTVDINDAIGLVVQDGSGAGAAPTLELAGELESDLDLTTDEIGVDVDFVGGRVTVAEGATLTVNDAQIDGTSVFGDGAVDVTVDEDSIAADGTYEVTLDTGVQASIAFATDGNDEVVANNWDITGFDSDDVLDFSMIAENAGLSGEGFAQYTPGDASASVVAFSYVLTDLTENNTVDGEDVAELFATANLGQGANSINDDFAAEAQHIFLLANEDGDAQAWYWDDLAGNSDGVVDDTELTQIANLNDFDADLVGNLTAANVEVA